MDTQHGGGGPGSDIIVGADAGLRRALDGLAETSRIACFAGLPGTGKSLIIHQLAHLAHARGRRIAMLQWDTARPLFEASAAGQRYPQADGVTHGIIRVAVGRWARQAVAGWQRGHAGDDWLLIGETPFVGHRLVELARPMDDAAEPILRDPGCRFIVPVPSRAVRQHMEAERERRMRAPQHAREKEDAPARVMRELWQQLAQVAAALGLAPPAHDPAAPAPYDPDVYRAVYLHVLRARHAQALPLDVILPAAGFSAYDFRVARDELLPEPEAIARYIGEAERAFPGTGTTLQHEIEHWYA